MNLAKFHAILVISVIVSVTVGFYQVTVVDLAQFLVVYVLKEKVHHLGVHLVLFLYDLGFRFLLGTGVVDRFYLSEVCLFRYESLVPADEKVVSV